jgi:transposase-like protein
MNDPQSERYREINRTNMNKPVPELVCPRCESRNVVRGRETSDHPGCFACRDCAEMFWA